MSRYENLFGQKFGRLVPYAVERGSGSRVFLGRLLYGPRRFRESLVPWQNSGEVTGMTDREKVMGVDLTGYRLSDESLKRILEDTIKDIRLRRMHGIYDMPIGNCIMIELVARELERNEKKGGDGDG